MVLKQGEVKEVEEPVHLSSISDLGSLSFTPGFNRVTQEPFQFLPTVSTVSDFLGRSKPLKRLVAILSLSSSG